MNSIQILEVFSTAGRCRGELHGILKIRCGQQPERLALAVFYPPTAAQCPPAAAPTPFRSCLPWRRSRPARAAALIRAVAIKMGRSKGAADVFRRVLPRTVQPVSTTAAWLPIRKPRRNRGLPLFGPYLIFHAGGYGLVPFRRSHASRSLSLRSPRLYSGEGGHHVGHHVLVVVVGVRADCSLSPLLPARAVPMGGALPTLPKRNCFLIFRLFLTTTSIWGHCHKSGTAVSPARKNPEKAWFPTPWGVTHKAAGRMARIRMISGPLGNVYMAVTHPSSFIPHRSSLPQFST